MKQDDVVNRQREKGMEQICSGNCRKGKINGRISSGFLQTFPGFF